MVRIRKILCPHDFFPPSETALAYAVSLARTFYARIRIVHVVPPATSYFPQDKGEVVKSAYEESQLRLASIATAVKAAGVHASAEVRLGEIDREILNAADEYKADLMVAATHGRRGFQHWLIGSTCERLLKRAHVPILTIGPVKRPRDASNFKRILIGIDFSDASEEVASWGFSIAKKFQSDVTLLHVADLAVGDIPKPYKSSLLEGIRLELEQFVPSDAEACSKVTRRVEFGMPFQHILKLAQSGKADLIVIGTHGKGMLDRALLGTSAERIIRGAPCATLSVPPKASRKEQIA